MRKIITYSTLGDNMKEIYSSATVLGELHPDLTAAGVRFEGMRLMTNPGQVTLESLQAELPEGEFQLFIMPQKVKSGSDEELISDGEGISWTDEDWSVEDPEQWVFATHKDLAIARAKRACALLEKAINHLAGMKGTNSGKVMPSPTDPIMDKLREEAAKLQRSIGMFE